MGLIPISFRRVQYDPTALCPHSVWFPAVRHDVPAGHRNRDISGDWHGAGIRRVMDGIVDICVTRSLPRRTGRRTHHAALGGGGNTATKLNH